MPAQTRRQAAALLSLFTGGRAAAYEASVPRQSELIVYTQPAAAGAAAQRASPPHCR